jgi:hypothetical protein
MSSEKTMDFEIQLVAMRAVMEALKPLDEQARESVLEWVDRQLGRKPVSSEKIAGEVKAEQRSVVRDGTVSMVAQKLGAKSARDLFLAAATHLTLFQGKDSFTKEDLISCAKEARGWKVEYSNQMAINITRMLNAGELFERARNVFSLSDSSMATVEEKLTA